MILADCTEAAASDESRQSSELVSMQTIVGNGKKVELPRNTAVLRVVGNSCFVSVARNEGQILVTGNKGHVQVAENLGHIYYTGNNGLIEVGATTQGIGQVVYTGNGGKVTRMKTSGASGRQESQPRAKKVNVQSELIVNGVEVCLNQKPKQQEATPASSCRQEARRTPSKKYVRKTTNIQLSHTRNIQVVNLPNLDLENWCLNLATELVAL
ncbi:uncharacterized protein pirk [Periplaneta americana]|uniref:uncharacterized protein pirk n=1 Tax=Periplaneta americana TaxID=6978 RepID=UPI0037E9411A